MRMDSQNEDFHFNIDETHKLGPGFSFGLQGLTETAHHLYGGEGRIHIMITNTLEQDIHIHFLGGGNKEKREILETKMTRVFSKKPSDGLLPGKGPVNYECEFWAGNMHARIYVYGVRAPRKNNRFEAREDGLYLIDKYGEFFVYKWETDEVDSQAKSA